ncbi:MAG: pentapeptide repeat-containing protein [Ekhidna sp.]|nr:pentapeptide repeat-containing protein [Ekhidna sp.]
MIPKKQTFHTPIYEGLSCKGLIIQWAKLIKADLQRANLFRADLQGANLSSAKIGRHYKEWLTGISIQGIYEVKWI